MPPSDSGSSPTAAIGGTEEVMAVVEDGSVYQVGTFGKPLTMAAARVSLLETLTPEAYELDGINERLLAGCQDVIIVQDTSGRRLSRSWPGSKT